MKAYLPLDTLFEINFYQNTGFLQKLYEPTKQIAKKPYMQYFDKMKNNYLVFHSPKNLANFETISLSKNLLFIKNVYLTMMIVIILPKQALNSFEAYLLQRPICQVLLTTGPEC